MKKILKMFFGSFIIITALCLLMPVKAEAAYNCARSGCDNARRYGSSYCYVHSRAKTATNARSSSKKSYYKYKPCLKDGCNRRVFKTGIYCYEHTPKSSTSYGGKYSAGKSSYSYGKYSSSKTYKKSSSNKWKTEMPDCDDYEDYDDFMDDWDGNMPDGSDAEDYWENW